MKTRVIISAIAFAASLIACTSPEKEVGTTTNNTTVAPTETVQPEPQPVATHTDYAYSYTEPGVIICEYPTIVPPVPTITLEKAEEIIKDVIPMPKYEGTGNAKEDFYNYVAAQNTTVQTINPLFGGTVIGKQGTTIYIPEDAFETMDSTEVDEPVTITF